MKNSLLFRPQWLLVLKLKILLRTEQMEVADCQQMAQSRVGTSRGAAEWLWEVALLRIRLLAAGPDQGSSGRGTA